MNNFFKMSLVAAAIAVSGTATAGTFTNDNTGAPVGILGSVFSTEGVAITTATKQKGSNLFYKFGTDYEAGAKLTFTFTAGALDSSSVFKDSVLVQDDAVTPTAVVGTFTKSAQTADSVTYTLTAKNSASNNLTGKIFEIAAADFTAATPTTGYALTTAAIKTGAVTVKATAEYQGVAFDPDATVTTAAPKANYLASTATQFGKFSVSALIDGKIAAATAGGLGKVLDDADILSATYTPIVNNTMKAVIGDSTDVVNNLGSLVLTAKSSVVGDYAGMVVGGFVPSVAATKVALTSNGFDMSGPITGVVSTATPVVFTTTITPTSSNAALKIQDFNLTPSISYTGGVVTADTLGAGSWTVLDENASVTYMPYGNGISQVIYFTNTSVDDAEVSVTATDENGVKYALGALVTAKGNGKITKVTDEVKQALRAQGFTEGKVSLKFYFVGVTAGATPEVKVYSAYNVNGTDRGFVANTTNGAK